MVAAVAEWMTLLELCEDAMHRLMDYEILCVYDFDTVVKKLKEKWNVSLHQKPQFLEKIKDKTQTKVIEFLASLTDQIYKATSFIGVATYVSHEAQAAIVGFSIHNPQLIAAAVMGAVIAKLGAIQLTEVALHKELEQWANYFHKVANNLFVYYKHLNELTAEYFITKDLKSIQNALEDLVEAHGRD